MVESCSLVVAIIVVTMTRMLLLSLCAALAMTRDRADAVIERTFVSLETCKSFADSLNMTMMMMVIMI